MNYWNPPMSALIASVALCLLVTDVSSAEKKSSDKKSAEKKDTSFEVRLYNKKQFEGRYMKLKVEDPCHNLPPAWDKQVASVDPLGCVILFAEPDCRGLRRRLERWSWGSSSLKDISFENMISSLSPCPIVKKIVIPTDDEL